MAGTALQLVVVTPERVLLNESATALRFPLYDGDIGILPGRAPLIGRLGTGELRLKQGDTDRRFFIDGGFVQVNGSTITLLTERAVPADQLKVDDAEKQLAAALSRVAKTDVEQAAKTRDITRARKQLAVARRP